MSLNGAVHGDGRYMNLLPALTVGAAVSATTTTPVLYLAGMEYLVVSAKFLFGAAGTSVKVYVQTSVDNGDTWIDIMSFAFAGAAATKVSSVNSYVSVTAITPTDGSLADNTVVNGVLGDRVRLKYVTTGTYTGATSIEIDAMAKG